MATIKYLAPALLCLTATTLTATAAAEPAPAPAPALQLQGIDHGVAYDVALSPDERSAIGTLQAGRFLPTWDGEAVVVTDDNGAQISTIPLKYEIDGKTAQFTPVVDQDNHRLTLTPIDESDAPVRDVDARQHFYDMVQANWPSVSATATTGALIGAAIGLVLGFPVGLFLIDFVTVPLLAVVGGMIGGAIGLQQSGGQPAVDATIAYAETIIPGSSAVLGPAFALLPPPRVN